MLNSQNLDISKIEENSLGLYLLARMTLSVFIKIRGRGLMNISC